VLVLWLAAGQEVDHCGWMPLVCPNFVAATTVTIQAFTQCLLMQFCQSVKQNEPLFPQNENGMKLPFHELVAMIEKYHPQEMNKYDLWSCRKKQIMSSWTSWWQISGCFPG
jgi:hypothetical protein